MAGESKLQRKCGEFAKRHHILMRKIHAEGRKGFPDLVLIFPHGLVIFVEMKNPNMKGVLAKLQIIEHWKIQAQNAIVYTCDSYEQFKSIIKRHLKWNLN